MSTTNQFVGYYIDLMWTKEKHKMLEIHLEYLFYLYFFSNFPVNNLKPFVKILLQTVTKKAEVEILENVWDIIYSILSK